MRDDVYTQDDLNLFSAWSDYRKEYGASGQEAYDEFKAGWRAARDMWTVTFDLHTMDWKAGFDAFYDNLDIGGVMR